MPLGFSRPFATEEGAEPLLAQMMESNVITVMPVAGAPPSFASLAEDVAMAARKKDIIAFPGEAETAIAEILSGTWLPGSGSAPPRIRWALTDPETNRADSFDIEVTQAFAARLGAEMGLSPVVEATVTRLAALVDARKGLRPAAMARPSIAVGEIAGAPGDGNRALASNLRGLLAETGYGALRRGSDAGAPYRVGAVVDVTPQPAAGGDLVRLSWRVATPDGAAIASIDQENLVPPGTLDQRWGEIAYFAAAAALEGIIEAVNAAHRSQIGG